MHALIDTGASCSVIDSGSLGIFTSITKVDPTHHSLVDATGNTMDLIGSIDVIVEFCGVKVVQNFKVLRPKCVYATRCLCLCLCLC